MSSVAHVVAGLLLLSPLVAHAEQPANPSMSPKAPKAEEPMRVVLDAFAALGPRPLESLTPAEARRQPTPADAVKAVLKARGAATTPEAVAKVEDRTYRSAGTELPIRVYTPKGPGPFPMIVYFHGGGWVIANLDVYDASPRALANAADAIVVSASYRQAPEHKFPAAHDDAFEAYKWAVANAASLGADPTRIAVAGESAGGNLAFNVAARARDEKLVAQPRHMLLVYPVAGRDMTTESYLANAMAKPLGKAGMQWFVKHVFSSPAQTADPRIDLVSRTDLAGLPSATIITAEIDPLRSEGKRLAAKLTSAGVIVDHADYTGVTHEFFGMAAVEPKAKAAQVRAGKNLRLALKAKGAKKAPLGQP